MNKNKYEEYIKEFDDTGVSNLFDLVRLGGIELIDDMLKINFLFSILMLLMMRWGMKLTVVTQT